MWRKRYTEEQIAFALRQAESGTLVAEIVRKMGISEQTFYRWKKYAGRGVAVVGLAGDSTRPEDRTARGLGLLRAVRFGGSVKQPATWSRREGVDYPEV